MIQLQPTQKQLHPTVEIRTSLSSTHTPQSDEPQKPLDATLCIPFWVVGEESLYDVRGWLSRTVLAIHCLNGAKSTYEKLLTQCKSRSTVFTM